MVVRRDFVFVLTDFVKLDIQNRPPNAADSRHNQSDDSHTWPHRCEGRLPCSIHSPSYWDIRNLTYDLSIQLSRVTESCPEIRRGEET